VTTGRGVDSVSKKLSVVRKVVFFDDCSGCQAMIHHKTVIRGLELYRLVGSQWIWQKLGKFCRHKCRRLGDLHMCRGKSAVPDLARRDSVLTRSLRVHDL
jgi:hypothetical protein